jgi:3-methyl-2-oxobutanoate hydroxymethyltransferase
MRITIRDLQAMKERGEKIAMLTAYDFATARLLDAAGVPLLLVGDSLGMVVLGYDSTIPVTLEEMLHHTRAVVRGTQRALVVGDMPFMTYHITESEALRNAARFLQEAGAQAVKLEGGGPRVATVQRIVESGIPVMGHLGLTPQSVHQLGGFRAQAKSAEEARCLLEDALRLEDAGAFALVLECIPAELAAVVSQRLRIPTIGIGAGPDCDGQVQVIHDLLGLIADFVPKHAKRYAHLAPVIQEAVQTYLAEVQQGQFPTEEHSIRLGAEALAEVLKAVGPAA